MFSVVQTRKQKNAKPYLACVPCNWVVENQVYWPPQNVSILAKNSESKPDLITWKGFECKTLGKFKTLRAAEKHMALIENKKQAFTSESYTLSADQMNDEDVTSKTGHSKTSFSMESRSVESLSGSTQEQQSEIKNEIFERLNQIDDEEQESVLHTVDPLSGATQEQLSEIKNEIYDRLNQMEVEDHESVLQSLETHSGAIQEQLSEIKNEIFERLNQMEHRSEERFQILQKEQMKQKRQLSDFMVAFKLFMKKKVVDEQEEIPAHAEDFSMFTEMSRIDEVEALIAFDQLLEDNEYFSKFLRFISSEYLLNGKRDSNAFFKVLIRKLVHPNIFSGYTCKGMKNKGFLNSFPNFVRLMSAAMFKADCNFKTEQINRLFDIYMRQKTKEIIREAKRVERNMLPRVVTSRKRKITQTVTPEANIKNESNESNDSTEF